MVEKMICKNCDKAMTADYTAFPFHEYGYCNAACMDESRGDDESQYIEPGETPPEWVQDTPAEFTRAMLGKLSASKKGEKKQ